MGKNKKMKTTKVRVVVRMYSTVKDGVRTFLRTTEMILTYFILILLNSRYLLIND